MSNHFLYLALDLGCILFPFLFSFDPRTRFYLSWKPLFAGIAVMMVVFIPWDIAFTRAGYWGFNEHYLMGKGLWGLPVEEWLFFVCVPYACLFSYVSVGYYFPHDPLKYASKYISYGVMALCVFLLIFYHNHAYTALTSALTLLLTGYLVFIHRAAWLARFYLTYIFVMVPFLGVNGVLTGISFWKYPLLNTQPEQIADQIVWYNNAQNSGVRIFTIPADDFLYAFLMVLLVTTVFERIRSYQAKTAETA